MSFRKYEHINPGQFDKEITIKQVSTSKNALGEDVRVYTTMGTQRGMFGHTDAAMEDIEKNVVKSHKVVGKVITWYNELLLDTKNVIELDGNIYDIVEAEEVYGRKRFVRLKVMQYL